MDRVPWAGIAVVVLLIVLWLWAEKRHGNREN